MGIAPVDLDAGGKALSSSSVVPVPESEPSPLELLSRRRVGSVEVCRSEGAFLRNGLRMMTGMVVAGGRSLCRGCMKARRGWLFLASKNLGSGEAEQGAARMVCSWCGERRLDVAERFQTDVGSRGVDRVLGKRPVPNVTGRCDEVRREQRSSEGRSELTVRLYGTD